MGSQPDLNVTVRPGPGVLDKLHHVPHVQGHVHDQLSVVLGSLRSSGHTNEAILRSDDDGYSFLYSIDSHLDSFDLVDLVLIGEDIKHAEHVIQHANNLHSVTLGADVAKHRDVIEDDGDHLEDLACLHSAGTLLDLLGHGLGHHLAEELVTAPHLVIQLHHGLLHGLGLLHLSRQGILDKYKLSHPFNDKTKHFRLRQDEAQI